MSTIQEVLKYKFQEISPECNRARQKFIKGYFTFSPAFGDSKLEEQTWEALRTLGSMNVEFNQDKFWDGMIRRGYIKDQSWENIAKGIRTEAKKFTYTPNDWDLDPHQETLIDPCFDGENLEGSPKQVNWAHKIRSEIVSSILQHHRFKETSWLSFEELLEFLKKSPKQAKFWIENREEKEDEITTKILSRP